MSGASGQTYQTLPIPCVTVVSGLPRSGTSLVMQMLAAGGMPILTDGIRAADVDNPHGYLEFEPVKRIREDSSWLEGASGMAVKMVYALLYDLPPTYEYRVILVRRSLSETIASQRSMLRRLGREGAEVSDERLSILFQKEMDKIAEWLGAQRNVRFLEVSHRNCLYDARTVAEGISRFLGGGLDVLRMAEVPDPALHRLKH
jgi:hypothetical protein